MSVMSLLSRAPSRIDLAGGTLDIWPLYLLIDSAATVNVAIDLFAEARLTPADEKLVVHERETGRETAAVTPEELEKLPGAELAGALLQVFQCRKPLCITIHSMAPPQSGLGASSALGIAIAGALNHLNDFRYDPVDLVEIVKNVEARILGAMTGTQDHYPPVYGGANCIWWNLDGARREALPLEPQAFEERFVLAYTHQPHRSGANNWEVVKRFLDGDGSTREALGAIGRIAVRMRDAVLEGDLEEAAFLLGEEWEARRQLAPEVSSPETERILDAAFSAGATSGKVCGAGGGGCLLIATRPVNRSDVETAIRETGGSTIDYHVAQQGFEIIPDDDRKSGASY
jgi:D-glycero-alpha-D-manno-heptose-7-phosphate kinase